MANRPTRLITNNSPNIDQCHYAIVTVQARNTSGLWSVDGVSNAVSGGAVTSTNIYLPAVQR